MGKGATLTYLYKGKKHARFLNGDVFRIGRFEENDLSFDNPYISRYHIEIVAEGDEYHIHDLDSTSGTFVNEDKIKDSVLKDGDRIRLGRGHGVEFLFQARGTDEGTAELDEEAEVSLQPIRVVPPENSRFIDTTRLSDSGNLTTSTVDRLRALYEFSSEVLTAHGSQELSNMLAKFMHRTLSADRCAVMLWNKERGLLQAKSTCPEDKAITPSSSITNRVYHENVAVLSLDATSDSRFSSGDSIRFQSIRSVMCAPIGSKTKLWGVCYVDNLTTVRAFDDEELEFLTAVARQAGLAMENLYLLEEQRRSLESFIRTLAASLDARDDNTAGHSARVGAYSIAIAKIMRLSEADARLIYYAGLLHDYGKIGIRDDVLLKPAELTPEEYEHVKQHPLHTYRLLSKIRLPEDLTEIPAVAAAHHERWDGSGYPYGLKGEEIPIGSRIVAVADAYDALTEERVYHEPWDAPRAMAEITMRSGTYFDPDVVEAFVQYFNQEVEPRLRRKLKTEEGPPITEEGPPITVEP